MCIIKYHTSKGFLDFKEISHKEFEILKESVEYVKFYRQFEELFELVRFNINELWTYLVNISEYHRLNAIVEYDDFFDPILISNQRLANILTSHRTFIDHVAHKFSQRYGKNSDELNKFNLITKELFDHNFAYRFFSKLRNFLQHYGLPITRILFNKHFDEISKKNVFHSVSIFIKKDELLDYDGWGKVVLSDLTKIKEDINVKNLLNEFFSSIVILYKKLKEILIPQFENAQNQILTIYEDCLTFIKEPKYKYDFVALYVIAVCNINEDSEESVYLPIDMIKKINKLINRHLLNEHNIKFSYTNMLY